MNVTIKKGPVTIAGWKAEINRWLDVMRSGENHDKPLAPVHYSMIWDTVSELRAELAVEYRLQADYLRDLLAWNEPEDGEDAYQIARDLAVHEEQLARDARVMSDWWAKKARKAKWAARAS